MQAQLSRTLRMSYADVGRMGYGEALVASVRFARLEQDKINALAAGSSGYQNQRGA